MRVNAAPSAPQVIEPAPGSVERLTFLCVAPHVPHLDVPHAGGLFLYHYLLALSRRYDVRLISPATRHNVAGAHACPSPISLYLFPASAAPTGWAQRAHRFARKLAGGLAPGPVVHAFRRDPTVRRWLGEADIVEIQWAEYLRMLPAIRAVNRHAPIGVVEHDVASEALARRARSATSRKERLGARVQLQVAVRQEPALINRCDVAYVFKAADADLLAKLGVTTPVRVLDPYLQAPETPVGARKPDSVLFVGALSRPENWEGLDWFLDQVWPKILGERPQASLVIAGADPPRPLLRRAGGSVTVTGWVDRLDPFYEQAMVFVAPVFSGAGLRFKVPQAMLYGLPVVGTPLALEGVSPPAPSSAVGGVLDDADAMARCIASLLAEPDRAAEIGARARQWAAERYSFAGTVATALGGYTSLASPARRPAGAGPNSKGLRGC